MRPTLGELARTLLTVGATAYGGPAIVAQLREELVERRGWVSEDEFRETLAFCQMLPGPTAVQTAAHVGWRLYGGPGAAVALVAYASPAFLLMLALSAAYFRFGALDAVVVAFRGLGAVIVAIVAQSILSLAKPAVRDLRGLLITAAAAWGVFTGHATLLVLALAAVGGAALFALTNGDAEDEAGHVPLDRSLPPAWRTLASSGGVAAAGVALLLVIATASPRLATLGLTMAKINLAAFGGGYTAIALMFREVVGNTAHAWLTAREFIDGMALSQVTPGPVIITATFIGYREAGLLGALVATLFVFLPSSLLLVVLAPHFDRLRRLAPVRHAIRGLLGGFVALLLFVLARVAESAFADLRALPVALVAFVALRRGAPMVVVILASVAVSFVFLR